MYTYFNIFTAFLAHCMKNGVKNHLLKLKNVKKLKKMNKIRIFDGLECLLVLVLAFILMSVHNYVRSFNVRPNKVR